MEKELEFYKRMCLEQVSLLELKTFILLDQEQKLFNQLDQKADKLYIEVKNAVAMSLEQRIKFASEFSKIKTIIQLRQTMEHFNLDGEIAIIDACNIVLNGKENCDIIIGEATEDELQIYVYNLMKQFEAENGSIEFSFQKRK